MLREAQDVVHENTAQKEHRMERDHAHTIETLELTNQFVTRAIGIFVAYTWSQFFVRCLGSVFENEPNPAKWDAEQKLVPYCVWFALILAVGPSVKSALGGYKHAGAKSVSYSFDFCQLFECSINTILGWGYKDICAQAIGCLPNMPTNFPESWSDLGRSVKYSLLVCAVAMAATLGCAFIMIALKIVSKDRPKSFAHHALAAPPS